MQGKTIWLSIVAVIIIVAIAAVIWYIVGPNNNSYDANESYTPTSTSDQTYATGTTAVSPTSTAISTSTPAPTSTTVGPRVVGPGARCGGNMLNAPVCQSGYHCAPTPGSHLPFGDVGGTCVVNQPVPSY